MRKMHCPRCSERLNFLGTKELFPGKDGMEIEIYACPKCGKMEFFAPEGQGEAVAKTKCACGAEYDIDFPRCPSCGRKNEAFAPGN